MVNSTKMLLNNIPTLNGVSLMLNVSAKDVSFISTNLYLFRNLAIILRPLDILLPGLRNKTTKIPFLGYNFRMSSLLRRLALISIPVLLVIACKNNDSWMGRVWNNTNAHYNSYFNAEQDWLSTVQTMQEGYSDDYRSFIELYNYGSETVLKGNQGAMDAIVKTLSTVIDKHPKSKWVDNCYLLMGKAYFMKGDFFAATDIFEFVNSNFKDPEVVYDARLWIFQSLYYQKKYTEAENLAVSLKNDAKFPKKLLPQLNKALGAILLKNDKPGQAVEFLEKSLHSIHGKMEKYRLHFALGQAYQKLEQWEKATTHYAKTYRMNPPYDMAFNSEINRVEILSQQQKNYAKANQLLKRMLKDDKNTDYFGQIYYRLGINELRQKNEVRAINYLQQSLANSKKDRTQTTTTYLTLGDFWFDHKQYEQAGLYYDSANHLLDESHPDYQNIARRGAVLGELLRHLITIKKQDSLLRLGRDPILREKTIDKIIENEKKAAAMAKSNPNPPGGSNPFPSDPNPGGTMTPSSFPFYNTDNRNRGKDDFQKNWGTRTNRDFWRFNAKKSTSSNSTTGDSAEKPADTLNAAIYGTADRKKYYTEIPVTKDAQADAEKKIEEAMFSAAGVYQNSLNSPADAIRMYTDLLKRFPGSKYEAQCLYELAKLSKQLGKDDDFESYKALLSQKYPESMYLKLLKDPNAKVESENNVLGVARKEIEDLYNQMFDLYTAGQYQQAMDVKIATDKKFAGNTLQAKFDYMYGLCLIKSGAVEKGISSLTQVTQDYPGTDVAARAQETIDAYNRILHPPAQDSTSAASDSLVGSDASLWKPWDNTEELYYILVYKKGTNSNLLRAGINDFNKTNFVFEPNLEVSPTRAFGETVYISVSNFTTTKACLDYYAYMKDKPDFFASKGLFEYEMAWISKTNYTTLLKNNRANSYVDFFKTIK